MPSGSDKSRKRLTWRCCPHVVPKGPESDLVTGCEGAAAWGAPTLASPRLGLLNCPGVCVGGADIPVSAQLLGFVDATAGWCDEAPRCTASTLMEALFCWGDFLKGFFWSKHSLFE